MRAEQGSKKEVEKRPTHFDLAPIKKALHAFCINNCESRSALRTLFINNNDLVSSVFVDQYEEPSFKRCIDLTEMASKLTGAGLNLESFQVENLGGILQCFGEIDHDHTWGERVPPETDEQRKAKMRLEIKRADKLKAEQAAKQTKKIEKTPEELEK